MENIKDILCTPPLPNGPAWPNPWPNTLTLSPHLFPSFPSFPVMCQPNRLGPARAPSFPFLPSPSSWANPAARPSATTRSSKPVARLPFLPPLSHLHRGT